MSTAVTPTPFRHVAFLSSKIGARPVGSRANQASADYIGSQLSSMGLSVTALPFHCPYWDHRSTQLSFGGKLLRAHANTYSPACDIIAPIYTASTLAELESVPATGGLLLVYGELSKEPIWPRYNPIMLPDFQRHFYELIDKIQPAAVITVGLREGDTLAMIEDAEFHIPSVTITPEDARVLLNAAGQNAHLKIDAVTTRADARHLVARKTGRDKTRIILCAHFDTKYGTPGAVDNANGVAVMLAAAAKLSHLSLQTSLEFVAFNSEEYYGCSNELSACYDNYLEFMGVGDDILAAINIDGVGHMVGTNTVTLLAHSDALSNLTDDILSDHPSMVRIDPWYESNHTFFYMRGIPSMALTSRAVHTMNHREGDNIAWVGSTKLDEVVAFVCALVEQLHTKAPNWTRR